MLYHPSQKSDNKRWRSVHPALHDDLFINLHEKKRLLSAAELWSLAKSKCGHWQSRNAVIDKVEMQSLTKSKCGHWQSRNVVIERSRNVVIERSRNVVIERNRNVVIERSRNDLPALVWTIYFVIGEILRFREKCFIPGLLWQVRTRFETLCMS